MLIKNPRLVIRTRGEYFIIKNLNTGNIGSLNPEGYFIWQCLDFTDKPQVIAENLSATYQIDFDHALADVSAMLDIFLAHGLLKDTESAVTPNENTSMREPVQVSVSPDSGKFLPVTKPDLSRAYPGPFINKAGLVVTSKCNFSCNHCYIDPGVQDNVPLVAWKRAIHELKAMGCLEIMITGGEPLLLPWLWELLDLIEEEKFRFSINTNGSLLDQTKIKRLKQYSFLDFVSVTIYGLTNETFTKVTNRHLDASQILQNCRDLLAAGIKGDLKFFAMQSNLSDLPFLEEFAEKYGVQFVNKVNLIHPACDGNMKPLAENLSPEQIAELVKKNQLALSTNFNPLVHCGLERCSINSNGDVSMCEMVDKFIFGSILNESLQAIWQRQAQKHTPYQSSPACIKCTVQRFCPRCDGLSYLSGAINDNIAGEVPSLCKYAHAIANLTSD